MNTEDMAALAAEFAEIAADIRGQGAAGQWRRIGRLAVAQVPGCSWASVSDLHTGHPRSLAASDPTATALDELQYALGEGPCLDSASAETSVLSTDLATEQRWPEFVARARGETSLRSVLAVRLPGREAAMNFYATRPNAFDDEATARAGILAAQAAGLLVVGEATEQSRNLETALDSSRQIGMAMGVLMSLHKITQQDAFDLLRLASQSLHRKLREVAAEVTETGALPDLRRHHAPKSHHRRTGSSRAVDGPAGRDSCSTDEAAVGRSPVGRLTTRLFASSTPTPCARSSTTT